MRKTVFSTSVVAIALVGLVAGGTPASAEPDPPHCPKGYWCLFTDEWLGGVPWYKSQGNWSGNIYLSSRGFLTIFNNGVPAPGKDHIQVKWLHSGRFWERCLHYNPGPGEYKMQIDKYDTFVKSVTWRGECD
ncbi:hypothetical protein ABZ897_23230 [Nonomuraea sp. NPDC046802]|uniref:hypothetical protein n=1 Tax=Nonomuraea sp. NPDC046802 TaxID=3154919 RepID=UPI0033CDB6FF